MKSSLIAALASLVLVEPVLAQTTDHFTCYKAKATSGSTKFVPIPGVSLVDRYRSSTVEVKKPKLLCAPTNKLGEDPTAPSHPDHLEDYQIKPTVKFTPALDQVVIDQFGTLRLDLKKPVGLQVPSAKDHAVQPPEPTNPAVDHFTCYKAKVSKLGAKFVRVPGVTLADQFGSMTVTLIKPRRLCVPTNKSNEEPGAESHPDHLVCYKIKQTSLPKFVTQSPLFVINQFGSETLDAKKPAELCVPASRPPVGPTATATPPVPTITTTPTPIDGETPTPTTTPTAAPSTTPTTTPVLSCSAPVPPDPVLSPYDDTFYDVPDPIVGSPGTVVRYRKVALAALSAMVPTPFDAWQVMYVSTDVADQPSVAMTTVIKPCNGATTTPRPLVSYHTAEDSDSMTCAPSYTMRLGTEKEEASLPPLLAEGWVVVVPDYEGMMQEGDDARDSAYTAGVQAGHGSLDGIRAAENFSVSHPEFGLDLDSDTPVGLWGYSGGGLATAWTAELAPTYAPELNIAGVAAGGVPPDITAIAKNIDGSPLSAIMLSGTIGMSQAYDEILGVLKNDAATTAMRDYFLSTCIGTYIGSQYACDSLDTYSTVPNAIELPWVQEILSRNHLGNVCSTWPFQPCMQDSECNDSDCVATPHGDSCTTAPFQSCTQASDCDAGSGVCRKKKPAAPLYVYHALNDELIPVAEVNALVTQYCDQGVTVSYYQDLASDHISLAVSGAPAAIAYLESRFAGVAAPSTCGLPILPGVLPPLPPCSP